MFVWTFGSFKRVIGDEQSHGGVRDRWTFGPFSCVMCVMMSSVTGVMKVSGTGASY